MPKKHLNSVFIHMWLSPQLHTYCFENKPPNLIKAKAHFYLLIHAQLPTGCAVANPHSESNHGLSIPDKPQRNITVEGSPGGKCAWPRWPLKIPPHMATSDSPSPCVVFSNQFFVIGCNIALFHWHMLRK